MSCMSIIISQLQPDDKKRSKDEQGKRSSKERSSQRSDAEKREQKVVFFMGHNWISLFSEGLHIFPLHFLHQSSKLHDCKLQ